MDNNFIPFMVFNEEPLLDFIPITVIVKLISIYGNFDKIHFKKQYTLWEFAIKFCLRKI